MNILRDFNLNKSDILKIFNQIIKYEKNNFDELLHILNLNSERIIKTVLLDFIINYLKIKGFIKIQKNHLELKTKINSIIMYNGFCVFFINEIIKEEKLFIELFINSEYKIKVSKLME